MPRANLDKETVIVKAAELVNKAGMDNITLKMLAEQLGVKSPSLYNHIEGIDDLKKQLMIYGWTQMEQRIIQSTIAVSGYDAVKAMCYAFYHYAAENPGVFHIMLWYNKFQDDETEKATAQLLTVIFKTTKSLNLPDDYCYHLIRTFRGFLEGFFLLANNGSFGHPLAIEDSFELSIDVLLAGIKALGEEWRKNEAQKCAKEKDIS